MPSEAYQRFLDSMVMNFDKWHDGIGYDLETLRQLEHEEQVSIEELLIEKLKKAGDWRDVQALAALGTYSASIAVDKARYHNIPKVRHYALGIALHNYNSEDATEQITLQLEQQVILAVEHGAFELAASMPTMRVKKALLNAARQPDSKIRGSVAAFLLYLCGLAPEPYDWSKRLFFLRFNGDKDSNELQGAWEELRRLTGL